ncbi:zinc finger MYM-type protein 1-like [Aphis craccivora]|uniref:Zinc finger MYM-type protein 1-like n=1 Tax=Aphis craccivora TaxID=307492 RepID=A0A6G0W224_APHCR|nr:zinc finger MYM-type protein 1-like [Aphis craccivora]
MLVISNFKSIIYILFCTLQIYFSLFRYGFQQVLCCVPECTKSASYLNDTSKCSLIITRCSLMLSSCLIFLQRCIDWFSLLKLSTRRNDREVRLKKFQIIYEMKTEFVVYLFILEDILQTINTLITLGNAANLIESIIDTFENSHSIESWETMWEQIKEFLKTNNNLIYFHILDALVVNMKNAVK